MKLLTKLNAKLLYLLFCTLTMLASRHSDYFTPSFLRDNSAVKDALYMDGFTPFVCQSGDYILLHGLQRIRQDALYNVILCPGWPSNKEQAAPFFALLKEERCNIYLFDGRTATGSWPLWKKLWLFGQHDFHDVIGIMRFVRSNNTLGTFILGSCAGAFNAAHAIAHLHTQGKLPAFNIKGLIFDSGWAVVDKISHTVTQLKTKKMVVKQLLRFYRLYGNKKSWQEVERSAAGKLLIPPSQATVALLHMLLFQPFFKGNEHRTNLLPKMHQLNIPILFIHSVDDDEACLADVQQMAERVSTKECWWIDKPSQHSRHHLKHRAEYQMRIINFCNRFF